MTDVETGAAAELPSDREPKKAERARIAKLVRSDFSRHYKDGDDPEDGDAPDRRDGLVDPFMRRRDVLRALGLPNSTFYELIARGDFPPGVRITKRCVGWRRSVVVAFMASREQVAA